jgi:serine/threonine protein kinase
LQAVLCIALGGSMIGKTISHYQILEKLGEGGMGEVYKARDTHLDRFVALKILPTEKVTDPDRSRRFVQEAKAASSLNHPHIITIHDIDEADGVHFIAMEHVDGKTLDQLIPRHGMRLSEALKVAVQVADALAAAHEAGIVHRDLKPGNLMVTDKGQVKVLDFGLAKLTEKIFPEPQDATITALPSTEEGKIVGTVAYMSPEQAEGKKADARSDIFSFGSVFYEMVTGRRAFQGDTPASTQAAILKENPQLASQIVQTLPRELERLIFRCLRKDLHQRFQHMDDVKISLEELQLESSAAALAPISAEKSLPRQFLNKMTLLVLGSGLVAGWGAAYWFNHSAPSQISGLHNLTYSGRDSSPAVSRDGSKIAFSSDRDGRSRIWLKYVGSSGYETPITSGSDQNPRFSPSGDMILFSRHENGHSSLYKQFILRGEASKLVEKAAFGDWSLDGRWIAFIRWEENRDGVNSVIGLVNEKGGEYRELARIPGEFLVHPRWSPDGSSIAAVPSPSSGGVKKKIYIVGAGITSFIKILPSASPGDLTISSAAWSGQGRELIYSQSEIVGAGVSGGGPAHIMLQEINTGRTKVLLSTPQSSSCLDIVGEGQLVFDVMSSYVTLREMSLEGKPDSRIARWLLNGYSNDRQPAYSPDGEWIVFSSNRSGNMDLWMFAVKTREVRQITSDPATDFDPIFMPDGQSVIFSSNRSGHFEIWITPIGGGGAKLLSSDGEDAENAVPTPDGNWILYASDNSTKQGIWKIRRDGSDASRLVAGDVYFPEVSPDGQHVAYVSNWESTLPILRVARISDGSSVPFEIPIELRNRNVGWLGKCKWLPDGKAIAFLGQNENGVNGIFLQDFRPGVDTMTTRRSLDTFDPQMAAESFGISPNGKRIAIAGWQQISSLMLAERIQSVFPSRQYPHR